jgi:hypothetical protein
VIRDRRRSDPAVAHRAGPHTDETSEGPHTTRSLVCAGLSNRLLCDPAEICRASANRKYTTQPRRRFEINVNGYRYSVAAKELSCQMINRLAAVDGFTLHLQLSNTAAWKSVIEYPLPCSICQGFHAEHRRSANTMLKTTLLANI